MIPARTLSECFVYYGTRPSNPVWSWSGRSEDGKTIAVTLWNDRFTPNGYRNFIDGEDPDLWRHKPGWRELADNLQHALDHSEVSIRAIIIEPKDPAARPRKIAKRYLDEDSFLRVVALDADAGTFELERVAPDAVNTSRSSAAP